MTNLRKLKTAFDLGAKTRKPELCSSVFRCELEMNLQLSDGRNNLPVQCENVGAVCPGVGISCAVCGMFLPGVCSTVCPMAGLFCGASGYLCMLNTSAASTTTAAPAASTTASTTTTAAPRF